MQLHHTSTILCFHNPAFEHRLSVNDPIKTRIKRRLNRFGGEEETFHHLPAISSSLSFLHGSCNLHSNISFIRFLSYRCINGFSTRIFLACVTCHPQIFPLYWILIVIIFIQTGSNRIEISCFKKVDSVLIFGNYQNKSKGWK